MLKTKSKPDDWFELSQSIIKSSITKDVSGCSINSKLELLNILKDVYLNQLFLMNILMLIIK